MSSLGVLCAALNLNVAQAAAGSRAEADAAFDRGLQRQRLGDTAGACAAFAESVRQVPLPHALLQLGNCQEASSPLEALAHFRKARELGQILPDAQQRDAYVAAATERISRLTSQLSQLQVVAGEPDSVRVRAEALDVRGVAVEPQPLATGGEPVLLVPGKYRLFLEAPGYRSRTHDVTLEPGATKRVALPALQADTTAAPLENTGGTLPRPISEPQRDALQDASASRPLWPWVLVGSGGALVAGGLVVGQLALAADNNLDENCGPAVDGTRSCSDEYQSDLDRVESFPLISDAMWISGAVLAGVGVTFLLLGQDSQDVASRPGGTESVRVAGGCVLGGCSLQLSGSF